MRLEKAAESQTKERIRCPMAMGSHAGLKRGVTKLALGKLTQMYVVVVMKGRQSSQVRGRDVVNDRWEVEG